MPLQGAAEIADFLDANTLIHRWLVAFFRNLTELPSESVPYWGFWNVFCGGPGHPDTGRTGVIAHSYHTASTYAALAPGFEPGGVDVLIETELRPEKLVGDQAPLAEWEARSPRLFARACSRDDLVVLELPPGALRRDLVPASGFRPATPADRQTLREFELLYATEMGEADPESDLASLIDEGLVFVLEVEGEIAGTVRSNLSDGRYVHAGGVFIHPRFRGRRLGPALVAGLGESIHRSGASVLFDTYASNEAALRTYRTVGFRQVGSGRSYRFSADAWRGVV